ncbi:MAG: redoxin domain-containing protein, partial [Dehalococcoidia bacterium]
MNVPRALLALCAAAATLALGGCAGDMEAGAPTTAGHYGGAIEGSVAPEFAGLGPWLNGEPVTIAALAAEDRVVLVDFWTYTCVNCLRTLPFLADWHEKYAGRGLTIVGVHAPEFEFEKDPQNVARAVRDLGVAYPVAQDDDWLTWEAFANNVWPAKYLVGADGTIVYRHFGEGDYLETEGAIRAALTEAGHDVADIALGGVATPELDPDVQGITRELYFGYERNYHPSGVYAAQDAYYEGPDLVLHYEDPGAPRSHNQWYAHGAWLNEREGLVHARATDDPAGYIAFRFAGRTVNPV